MKTNYIRPISLIVLGAILLVSFALGNKLFSAENYVEYIPVVLQKKYNGPHVQRPEINSPEHQQRIKFVLDVYKEQWMLSENGKVMIQKNLSDDMDLLWNYTSKAENEEWLESRLSRYGNNHSITLEGLLEHTYIED